ncbi:MAG: response regulator [Sulfurimonas sp.]|nr:response regulator [Sulfurimonas sp.]
MQKILILEDEEITAMTLEVFLNSLGYSISASVNSAKDAYTSIIENRPDLILCDIMIKGPISGSEFARDVHHKYNIPIIFLTAFCDDETIAYAQDANAYGYIVKPYKENELKATIAIVFNNIKNSSISCEKINFDDYTYDLRYDKFYKEDVELNIGNKASLLLKILLKNKNNVVSYEMLMSTIYENTEATTLDKLRHLVKRTKTKLEINSLTSVRNMGYTIEV